MKKTFLTIIFIAFFLVFFSNKAIACVALHSSCDAANTCCNFPSEQCQGGYCDTVTNPSCGVDTRQCCQSPNPPCGSGLTCFKGYCSLSAKVPTSTPIPTCGQHGQKCCTSGATCLISGDICIGGICNPPPQNYPCGNLNGTCCPHPTPPCMNITHACISSVCRAPTPTPVPAYSPPSSEGVINFGTLQNAIPGLSEPFKLGSGANVGRIISIIIPYLFVIAGLLLLFYLIYGGFHMMIAASDEKGLAEAKGKITNALFGFLILFLSYWIVQILQYILGIKVF